MENEKDAPVWYRQSWPWFIMVPPACAILGSAITIWLALSNPPQLVVEDYTRIEEINELNRRMSEAAQALNLTATVELEKLAGGNGRNISATLQSNDSAALPTEILLKLMHVSSEAFDRSTLLVLDGDTYRGTVDMQAAKYTIGLEDTASTWRLSGVLTAGKNSVALGN